MKEEEDDVKRESILYTSENTQQEGSIPRRLVAYSCIEALKTNVSKGKIIEITSSPDNHRLTMKQSIETFPL